MKADRYKTVIKILDSLYMEESNLIANLSNTAAVIKEYLGFFWVGFYLVDEESNQLIVGPYQGPLACGRIGYGKGVCGSSWKEAKTLVVKDVHEFPGHISCSPLSQSEIVVPIIKDEKVVAVLDIDHDEKATFDGEDKRYLERICEEMAKLF